MSTTYSSASVPFEPGSAVNALCLSLSSARKRHSIDEREPIKKRRKQLNPVRLPLEPIEDPPSRSPLYCDSPGAIVDADYDQHKTTYLNRPALSFTDVTNSEPSLTCKAVPERTFKPLSELESLESSSSLHENCVDSVPLNLTKNIRKSESRASLSPQPEDSVKRLKSESPDDKTDTSPTRARQPVMVMRNIFPNTVGRASTCRIFNPEAFCNICNKEFCNKYFLKTHKANKHGVYCENKETNANDTELPAVPLMLSWNVRNNTNAVKIPGTAAIAAAAAAVSNAYTFHANNTIKNSPAFCNVCEKEFCNKYFLRRHKEKMHGIVTSNENKKVGGDQSSEKSEEDERTSTEATTYQPDRISELNFNMKFDKTKFSKLPTSSADSVSDFIKLCLSGGSKILRERDKLSNGDLFEEKRRERDYDREEYLELSKHISKLAEHELNLGESAAARDKESTTCEYCKKTLSTRAVLKLHQKYVHAVSSDEDKEDSDFRHMESVYFMILKFSWLNTTVTFCEICHTDFEKNDALEMHLMNKHGMLVDELSRIIEDAGVNGLSAPSLNVGDGSILCQICSKTFPTNAAFQQHVYEKCNYSDVVSEFFSNSDDVDSSKSTRNFCEICKKELCNKYFMKTHMRRMHGISLQNGVRIGGVTCEICNKELCSKYFLRVHKKNCHGITEKANISRFMSGDSERPDMSQSCIICGRVFKSIKWLKTHLFNDHGKLGANVWQEVSTAFNMSDSANELTSAELLATMEMSSYSDDCEERRPTPPQLFDCSRCHFRLTSVEALLAHQRLHTKTSDEPHQYQCPHCFVVTKDKLSLEEHVAYNHFNTADFHEKFELAARFQVKNDVETIEKKNNVYRVPNTT